MTELVIRKWDFWAMIRTLILYTSILTQWPDDNDKLLTDE